MTFLVVPHILILLINHCKNSCTTLRCLSYVSHYKGINYSYRCWKADKSLTGRVPQKHHYITVNKQAWTP